MPIHMINYFDLTLSLEKIQREVNSLDFERFRSSGYTE